MNLLIVALFFSCCFFVVRLVAHRLTPAQRYMCQLWEWYTYHVDMLELYDQGSDAYNYHFREASFFNHLISTTHGH